MISAKHRLMAATLTIVVFAGCVQSGPAITPAPPSDSIIGMSIKNGTNAPLRIAPGTSQCMLQTPPKRTLAASEQWSGQVVMARTCAPDHWEFQVGFNASIKYGFAVASGEWVKNGTKPWVVLLLTSGLALKPEDAIDGVFHFTVVRRTPPRR